MDKECEKKENCSVVKWLVLLLLLISFLLGIMICIMLSPREKRGENIIDTTETHGGVGLIIDQNSEIYQTSESDGTEEQGVAISGRASITIPAGEREVTVDFYNPEENAQLYYLTFELRLYDDSKEGYEILYTSNLVEPGTHINRITLSRELEAGIYQAVIHVQPYRMNEEKTPTNNADMKTELIVK